MNTSGWIATDEMTFWLQHVQWAAPGSADFSMPVTWDEDNGDFDFGLSAEFAIPNNRLTVIPILLRSHWCAVEVNRTSHLVTVVVLGFPGPYFHTVVAAVARLLDFHPSRLAASIGPVANFPHMCGWVLLNRWISAAGLQDELPPANDGFEQVSLEKRALIEDVLVPRLRIGLLMAFRLMCGFSPSNCVVPSFRSLPETVCSRTLLPPFACMSTSLMCSHLFRLLISLQLASRCGHTLPFRTTTSSGVC